MCRMLLTTSGGNVYSGAPSAVRSVRALVVCTGNCFFLRKIAMGVSNSCGANWCASALANFIKSTLHHLLECINILKRDNTEQCYQTNIRDCSDDHRDGEKHIAAPPGGGHHYQAGDEYHCAGAGICPA